MGGELPEQERKRMAGHRSLHQARVIVMNCLYDELARILRGQGLRSVRIDSDVLVLYASTKLDARKYSPRLERR